jgi:hypothetical protein
MPTHQKATKMSATSMQNKDQIVFDSNLAYLDHFFATTWFVFANQNHFPISKSNSLVLGTKRDIPMEKIDQVPKTPPFPIIINSPPQETKFCNKSILDK